MNTFRLSGVVAGLAVLAGFASVASAQYVAGPVGVSMPMPMPVCGGCVLPMNPNPVNLNVPNLSAPTLTTSLNVPTVLVPPPPPAIEVRAYPVVVADRDRDRSVQQDEAPISLDTSSAAPTSYYGDSGHTSTPVETRSYDSAKSASQPSTVAAPAPWYSVGDWSFGTWVVIFILGFISLKSGKR